LTEGVEVTNMSSTILLPPGSQSVPAKLQVIPRTNGQMSVTGNQIVPYTMVELALQVTTNYHMQ